MDYKSVIMSTAEELAEYLYGATREQAIEWAKEDKFQGKFEQASDMLNLVVKAVERAGLVDINLGNLSYLAAAHFAAQGCNSCGVNLPCKSGPYCRREKSADPPKVGA